MIKSDFIWAKDREDEKNLHLIFSVTLNNVKNPVLKLAAENMYQIWCFDEFCGFGPARAADGKSRMDQYDLTEFVKDNSLVVTVEVAGFNIDTFCHADDKPFFAANILDQGEIKARSKDFVCYLADDTVQKVQRYSYQRTFLESKRLYSDRNRFFASGKFPFEVQKTENVTPPKILNRGVNYYRYLDVSSDKIIDRGTVKTDPDLPLFYDRSIIGVDEGKIKGYTQAEIEEMVSFEADRFSYKSENIRTENLTENTYALYDFCKIYSGFIGIELEVLEDATVYLLWDEILSNSEKMILDHTRIWLFNIIKYRLNKGKYNLLSFEPYVLRYLKLVVTKGEISNVKVKIKTMENQEYYNLKFSCDDKKIEKIFEAARRSGAQNALDILMDCPSRERGGWLCDSSFAAKGEWFFCGENKVEFNHLENFSMMKKEDVVRDNQLPMVVYPSSTRNYSVYDWPMWLAFQLDEYILRTKDLNFKERLKDYLDVALNYYCKRETKDGFLTGVSLFDYSKFREEYQKIDQDYLDIPLQMCYVKFLQTMANLYGYHHLLNKAETLKKLVLSTAKKGDFFVHFIKKEQNGYTFYPVLSEGAQWQAFYFGFASVEKDKKLLEFLLKECTPKNESTKLVAGSTFLTNIYKYSFLCSIGKFDEMLSHLTKTLFWMADLTDTLHEHDDLLSMSKTHGFTSVFAQIIARALLGIEYFNRAENCLYIHKNFANINAEISFPCADGEIVIQVNDGKRKITLPDGVKLKQL